MYEDLIKSLRICDSEDISCSECAYRHRDSEDRFVKFCGILGDSADAIEYLNNSIGDLTAYIENFEEILKKYEKVVRCYQCRYWRQSDGWCGIFRTIIKDPEFFCKEGEADMLKDFLNRKTVIDNVLEQMEASKDPNAIRHPG